MNVLNRAIQEEFEDFARKTIESINVEIDVSNKIGDIVVPIHNDRVLQAQEHFKSIYEIAGLGYRQRYYNYTDVFAVDINLIPFQNSDVTKIFATVLEIAKALKEEYFAGIIIMDNHSDYKINITHPVVAFLATLGFIQMPSEGKMAVYKFKVPYNRKLSNTISSYNENNYKRIYEATKTYWSDVITHLATTMIARIDNSTIRRQITKVAPGKTVQYIIQGVDFLGLEENIDASKTFKDHNLFYIPLQMLAGGVLYPYYGDIPFYDKSAPSAIIAPLTTGNLNFDIDETIGLYTKTRNICTGSYDNYTFRGLQTLSKINVSSLFHKYFVVNSALTLSEAAIDTSMDLMESYLKMKEEEKNAKTVTEETADELFEEA